MAARRHDSRPHPCARLTAALLLVCTLPVHAGDGPWRTANVLSAADREPLSGRVGSLTWLAGSWIGAGLGGEAEFTLSMPSAGSMAGTFKHTREGEVVFYEFIVIGEFEGRTAVRLKHFHPDMSGWEARQEWMEFPLLEVVPGRAAYFDGLSWRLSEEGGLSAFVVAPDSRGAEREFSFEYRRR